MSRRRDFSCAEVVGGIEATELSVRLPGARGEIWAQPYGGAPAGGDVHYVATCGVSQLSKVVLADVSGHGAAVADAARIIHAALVDNLNEHDNGRLLSSINRAFVSRSPGAFHFTTMVASIYDSANRTLVYAYAGHPPLLLGRRSTGRFESLDYDHGVPIGVVDDVLYEQRHLALEVGDVLV
ncbi:MAG: serine/threonine-protein phosphatase, partial [Planctomycetes bacterium]|nr:serine/threonine-protein phosphatase [Planctomycetota bacterium]